MGLGFLVLVGLFYKELFVVQGAVCGASRNSGECALKKWEGIGSIALDRDAVGSDGYQRSSIQYSNPT